MLSANTLFHFTNKTNLISILKVCAFYPRYCYEDIATHDASSNIHPDIAVPMVCFCDIPLSQIKNHINTYGSYGIGLKKEWGIDNGISPLQYMHPSSKSAKILNDETYLIQKLIENTKDDRNLSLFDGLRHLKLRSFLFLKPYEGRMFRDGLYKSEKIIFYDEKEWRFLPEVNLPDFRIIYEFDEFIKDENLKKKAHEDISVNFSLNFNINDISYIIIDNDNDIEFFLDKIDELFDNKFNSKEIKILKTKIITKSQIVNDF
ncbi:MAG: abortive infection system antitoxin AbiGi family protein [Bacteroidota bacterium]|nr:abortive infection system antitoxin AbiGi family protein [Bacteroidota bacterium]